MTTETKIKERFDAKWTPEPYSGCWIWTFCERSSQGYGGFKLDGKFVFAHRVSWELHRGKIPSGMFVCHKCDTPACVNPDHLFLGTSSTNMQDCRNKRRLNTKLSVAQVKAIRSDDRPERRIAQEYAVSHTQINKIKLHKKWRNV